MRIAILSALEAELRSLLDSAERQRTGEVGGWPMWSATIADHDVILARAGLGKVNTAALAGVLWERHRPDTFLFTGVAGGLDPALGIGDVVIAERTIQYDWGITTAVGLERYQAGHLPFYNPTEEFGFESSASLLTAMRSVAAGVRLSPVLDRVPEVVFGSVITGDQFLGAEHTRDRLFSELGAQAIEMEGAALGQTATRLGVDHLVIRSLSDLAASDSIDDFAGFVDEVSVNCARLVVELLERLQPRHAM